MLKVKSSRKKDGEKGEAKQPDNVHDEEKKRKKVVKKVAKVKKVSPAE